MKATLSTTLYLLLSASTAVFAVPIADQASAPIQLLSNTDILPRAASVALTTHDSTGKATTFNVPIDNQIHKFGKLRLLLALSERTLP